MASHDFSFEAPFTMIISGGSMSGKTEFTLKLLMHAAQMIKPKPDVIFYCYGKYQKRFQDVKKVDFINGFDEKLITRENLAGRNCLLVLDDLMDSMNSNTLSALFTKYAHHRRISTIFLVQNLYYKGIKSMRDIAQSTQYNVLMKQPRDRTAIMTLGRQMYPSKSKIFIESYDDATKLPFSYLLVDSKPLTSDNVRLCSKIFPGERTICYVPKR